VGSILAPLGSMSFDFIFRGDPEAVKRHKIVHFFLMRCIGGDICAYDDLEISDCRWFPMAEAATLLRFNDERGILLKAGSIFAGHGIDKTPPG
ncbi:MAG: hypothetical protein ACE5EZ_02650, partial [Thermodesulfobacteriota bacterium]